MSPAVRPSADEYAPPFASYVARIGDDEDIVAVLASQLTQLGARLAAIPEAAGDYRYAPGKWSLKEVAGHLCDTERIFAYRALRIARGDATPLPAFDDQTYVRAMQAPERTLADLIAEWGDVRRATLALFRGLPAAAWPRRGVAGDHVTSVRALAYVIAGHVRHHAEMLRVRYSV